MLSATACTLNQPDVIVITATFLPPTPTSAPPVVAPTPEPTLPPLPEGALIEPTDNPRARL
ncbi:MAG: hypothetical protein U0521_24810 [Anaerolineae bacterium]